ncbi:MAG: PQQ-binding-like beta-propeller repeat protein [Pirellulales bacterium]
MIQLIGRTVLNGAIHATRRCGPAWALGLFSLLAAAPTVAADWPAFRGPHGSGVADDVRAPLNWGRDRNVAWQVELPRPGNGSPIVSQGRVFVASAEDADGLQRSLYCLDAASGKQLWVRTAAAAKKHPTHDTNPYGGTTPASDGRRVVVWHASAGLYCYGHDGVELWKRDLGEFEHMWGYGTSPMLYDGKVILSTGPGKRCFIAAFDLASGKTLWETDEPLEGDANHNKAGKYHGTWSTPVVAKVEGRDQIIAVMPQRVVAYDPANGQILWWCGGVGHDRGDLSYSSPVLVGDVCFVTGGFRGPALAVRMGGSGDVTESRRLWRKENNPQSIGSGVVVDGLVYRPNAGPATLECLDPLTGKTRWAERAGVDYWASIIRVGDLLYAVDQNADTVVFKPNPEKLEVVATNKWGATCNSTLAAADGRLYLRTNKHLICFADAPRFPGVKSQWNGFDRYDFEVGGKKALVVVPKTPAKGNPWVWHGEFFGHKPAPDVKLLERGFHIVYLSVPDMLGAPEAVRHWNLLHQELTEKHHLSKKVSLVGLSRGGLYCYNWAAANPDKVACIYGDAPVCDFKSWPGGKGKGKGSPRDWKLVLERYGYKDDAEALASKANPVDNLEPLAKAHVPLLHVYGDADDVVPWDENTGVVAERYKKLGGDITLIAKPGVGHHPHGLDDPTPIVEFIARHGGAAAAEQP